MDINMIPGLRPSQSPPAASKSAAKSKKSDSKAPSSPQIDTFESTASKPWGNHMISGSSGKLHWNGSVPSSGTLEYFDPSTRDPIDWERLEKEYFTNRQITLDNADSLMSSVDHIVSMYVAVKSDLEERYGEQEDILAEKMDRLNGLFQGAKRQLSDSYEKNIGRFYESLGNKGIASSMGSSLSSAIDRRVAEMEKVGKDNGALNHGKGYSYEHKQLIMEVWALNQREEGILSEPAPEEEENLYSLEDLEAAGLMAKAVVNMNSGQLNLMSDEELGIYLASQYMKMSCALGHSKAGEKMSDLILSSFETYLNQYSGKALSTRKGAADAYQYVLDQYRSTKDMKNAVAEAGQRFVGDSFFSDFLHFGSDISMSLSTHYNLELNQFMSELEEYGPSAVISSVSGTGSHRLSAYI